MPKRKIVITISKILIKKEKEKNRRLLYRRAHADIMRQYSKKHYIKNKEKRQKQTKLWRENNKEKTREYVREYRSKLRIENPEKLRSFERKRKKRDPEQIRQRNKNYYIKHADCRRKYNKNYRLDNKEKFQKYKKEYSQRPEVKKRVKENRMYRYKNDIQFKIARLIRWRILSAIKKNNKSDRTINLLGCTIKDFKDYLESKFKIGMSWEKFGINGIHIDHIRPLSSFNLQLPEEQKKAFHYTNCQPLWSTTDVARANGDFESIGNLNKGDRLDDLVVL